MDTRNYNEPSNCGLEKCDCREDDNCGCSYPNNISSYNCGGSNRKQDTSPRTAPATDKETICTCSPSECDCGPQKPEIGK